MSSLRIFGVLAVLGCTVLACESGTETDPPDTGNPGSPSDPSNPENPSDPSVPPKPTCTAPTAGPTIHEGGDVGADEVWSANGSPHIVKQNVNVRNGAKLTIEPCAEVRVAKGKTINVAFPITPNTGTLVAKGTETQPIKIVGEEGERWASLSIRAGGTADLAYVTFENGGGDFQNGATIAAYGDGEDGADALLTVDHVTIKGSLGTGAWLSRGATFGEESRDLVVTGSGSDEAPYPLEIEEHAIDRVPTGSYTGNKKDEILIDPRGGRTAGSGLLEDATLHDRGVPYHVGRSKNHSLLIGGRPDEKLVTLTIEPGVKLRFTEGSALKVQHFTNQKPSTAALRALGTAAKPIVLTSALDAPAPGAWVGVWFGGIPAPSNEIDNVRIEWAGGDCGCILNTCSAITEHEGAVIFTAQPPSAFITNTTFANVAMHAITQGYDGSFVDFRPTNKFEGVSGCEQTRPREASTQCPSPKPACD